MGFRGYHLGRSISVVLFTIVVIVVLVGLWSIGQSRLRHDNKFELRAEHIQLFPEQPSWIRENVLQSVVKQHKESGRTRAVVGACGLGRAKVVSPERFAVHDRVGGGVCFFLM